jgi:hypothetical protein
MKGVWLVLAAGFLGALGCDSAPKRPMRPPAAEEFAIPPSGTYTTPPDIPRDQPLLAPKNGTAGPATGVPGPSIGGPGGGPGSIGPGAPGGIRR